MQQVPYTDTDVLQAPGSPEVSERRRERGRKGREATTTDMTTRTLVLGPGIQLNVELEDLGAGDQ